MSFKDMVNNDMVDNKFKIYRVLTFLCVTIILGFSVILFLSILMKCLMVLEIEIREEFIKEELKTKLKPFELAYFRYMHNYTGRNFYEENT